MIKQISNAKDILNLKNDDFIPKQALYNIIVGSKNPYYAAFLGPEYMIKNTPQQGINWIGDDIKPKAVIIKSKFGIYPQDGKNEYAFKANKGHIDKFEKANQVLINQKKYKYPILYFVESGIMWRLLGRFQVNEIKEKSVTLSPFGEEKKTLLNTIIAKRSVSLEKGKCKFIKEDSTVVLADDKGMQNSSLPMADENVKINIYKIEDNVLTCWGWEKQN